MTESMLAQYHRWNFEQQCVERLREWVIQVAEFQTVPAKALQGIWSNSSTRREIRRFLGQTRSLAGTPNQWPSNGRRTFRVWRNNHPIWYDEF